MNINHELLAQGRTADVYKLNSTQVVKLYNPGFKGIEQEFNTTLAAHKAGLPVAKPIQQTTIDGLSGIVFEYVPGPEQAELMFEKPEGYQQIALLLANVQRKVNRTSLPGLPNLKQVLAQKLQHSVIPTDLADIAAWQLERLPNGSKTCHCDLHPGNIILGPDTPVVIDWADAAKGHFVADTARTSLILRVAGSRAGMPRKIKSVLKNYLKPLNNEYLSCYYGANPLPATFKTWQAIWAVARLAEQVEGEQELLIKIARAVFG